MRKADSSLTTPEPTPKSRALRGPGTFGDSFAQNDSLLEMTRSIRVVLFHPRSSLDGAATVIAIARRMEMQILRSPPPNLPQRAGALRGPGTFGDSFAQNGTLLFRMCVFESVWRWRRSLFTEKDSAGYLIPDAANCSLRSTPLRWD